jgi:hypothetical protein
VKVAAAVVVRAVRVAIATDRIQELKEKGHPVGWPFFISAILSGSVPVALAVLADVIGALDAADALHMLVPAVQAATAFAMPEVRLRDVRRLCGDVLEQAQRCGRRRVRGCARKCDAGCKRDGCEPNIPEVFWFSEVTLAARHQAANRSIAGTRERCTAVATWRLS